MRSTSADHRVPPRALLLSLLALAAAAAGNFFFAPTAGGYELLFWLLALIPAFLLAYYRGWRGVAAAIAGGMAAISFTEAFVPIPEITGNRVLWLAIALAVYVGVCLGIGWLSEALHGRRRRAEEGRLETLAWLEAVVEGSPDAIFISDERAGLVRVNRAAGELTGYSREELLGMRLPDLHDDLDPAAYWEYHDRILDGMEVVTEAPILRRDGRKVPVEFNNRRIEVGGRPYVHTVARDITEREEAERERNRNLALMNALFEAVRGALLVEDLEGQAVHANARFSEMLGLDPSSDTLDGPDFRGLARSLADHFSRPDLFEEAVEARIASGDPVWAEELEMADGRTLERDHVPIRDTDGQLLGHLWHYRDVTERKVRENRLRQVQRLESLGELTGGIAHDFNNLLTVIGTNAELLAHRMGAFRSDPDLAPGTGPDDPGEKSESLEILGDLRAGISSATTLVRKLMVFGRQTALDPEPVELGDLLETEVRTLRRLIRANVELESIVDPDLPNALTDPASVQQILMNLVVNAQDAMAGGGTIRVAAERCRVGEERCRVGEEDVVEQENARPGIYTRLSVSDTGSGMDERTRRQIFEPFFTTKERGKGTGLGLAVVYGLVRDHGGWIDVVSRPGEGTTVSVYLPAAEESVAERLEPAAPPVPTAAGEETVLLVEDDPALRTTARRTLERLGYRVFTASDGAAALDLYEEREREVDLIVTDWMMPGIDGLDLIHRLRDRAPGTPCILMSGYPPEERGFGSSDLDPASFLQKPWTISELALAVRGALGG